MRDKKSLEITVRPESAADASAVRRVHQQAFGGAAEAALVNALRTQGYVRLSLVAVAEGQLVGHVLYSRAVISTPTSGVAALALAPIAVLPEYQCRGIGSMMLEASLQASVQLGERIVIVLGEPAFYGRFGFSAKLAEPLTSAYAGPYFQALELAPEALRGIAGPVEYPPPFSNV